MKGGLVRFGVSKVGIVDDDLQKLIAVTPSAAGHVARDTADPGPAVSATHLVRATYRDRPARPAARTRTRLKDDLLASVAALDRRPPLNSGANVPDIHCALDLLDGRPSPAADDPHAAAPNCRPTGTYPREALRHAYHDGSTEAQTTGLKDSSKLRHLVEQTFALPHQSRRHAAHPQQRLEIHHGHAPVLICRRKIDQLD
jgi:hypothetical protein